MLDDTIAARYRTGQGDRAIPLGLGLVGVFTLPLVGWFSGPFLWPWGFSALALVAGAVVAAFSRWWNALEAVVLTDGALEFRRGTKVRTLEFDSLTRVETRPSSVWTLLQTETKRRRLSHRLVQVEQLLALVRLKRPDLFPEPTEGLKLKNSSISALVQAALAGGTAGAGWALAVWQPWLGAFFAAAACYTLLRVFLFIPRGYELRTETLTVQYWLRRKTWHSPREVRQDSYPAGGAVFFRMRFFFGSRSVVLDEGQLLQPLRPLANWITQRMTRARPL